ncbi:DNA mismatch repair protein msh6 [Smittium mucronatum]|uniref:DNA mismatch repair protein n=1 Tax=Smittium mucronatum TaxID=133383 RepID=A0A1R0GN05_9FUNG|nr:DNA mismatch repair protein msh6 [Smittium mucronatum]
MKPSPIGSPRSNRGPKASQQPSLLSFFGSPSKQKNSNSIKDISQSPIPKDSKDLKPTQHIKSSSSIFIPKKQVSKSQDFHIFSEKIENKSKLFLQKVEEDCQETYIDNTLNSGKSQNDSQNQLEIVSKLPSISFIADIKQTPSMDSLFDDSDSFDFEVDEELLKKMEHNNNETLPLNSIEKTISIESERKIFKSNMDSDSSITDPSIDLDDDSFIADPDEATESEDEFLEPQPESSDEDYSINMEKKKNVGSRSSSYKSRSKKAKLMSSDESEIDDSIFDEIDIDNMVKKKGNPLPEIKMFQFNSQSMDSDESNIPLSEKISKSKALSNGYPVAKSRLAKEDLDSSTEEEVSLKRKSKANNNSSKHNESTIDKDSVLNNFKFGNGYGINSGRNSQLNVSNLALSKQINSKQVRVKEFADKNKDRYRWLLDIRDSKGRRPNENSYDPRTLLIPNNEWHRFTPFEKQYWEIKSKNWDTVVFFKKGKFYELYENDADIGHQHFDLKLTDRVNMRMVGVPESSFEHWASKFVAKGYKVAKVEQMESSLAKTMRERDGTDLSTGNKKIQKSSAPDKVVRRELTCVLTAGTLVDPKMLSGDLATYCLSIVETENLSIDDPESPSGTSFGIAFVDTSTAKFYVVGIQDDDINRTQLETLLVQINPKEVIFVSGGSGTSFAKNDTSKNSLGKTSSSLIDSGDGMSGISSPTWRTLKNSCSRSVIWNALQPNDTFWNFDKSKENLKSSEYFDISGNSDSDSLSIPYPPVLSSLESSPIGRLVYTAVGGLVSYLRSLMLDKTLVPIGNFEVYTPLKQSLSLMVDGATLNNLDIFSTNDQIQYEQNSDSEGTLFHLVNHTITPFGRRLLRLWLCHPLCDIKSINDRLDVVDYHLTGGGSNFFEKIESLLTGLPDLERYLSRVHSGSCRIPEWIKLLNCLNSLVNGMKIIKSKFINGEENGIPNRLIHIIGKLPLEQASEILTNMSKSFDLEKAINENSLVPLEGNYFEVDRLNSKIHHLDQWLDDHLKFHRKLYNCKNIVYKSIGKETYQLEIPRSITVPANYARKSATKDVHRYYSPELSNKLVEKAELNELLNAALREYRTVLYREFSRNYRLWMQLTNSLAELDVLYSLAKASQKMGFSSCRPTLLPNEFAGLDNGGFIDFVDLVHPCITEPNSSITDMSSTFVPNDIRLGTIIKQQSDISANTLANYNINTDLKDEASVILLTGPNMGGKSTLIRQVCIAIILAQLGCYIPAKSGKMTVFSRIFTRLGARDNLLMGRSTFMVEMAETASFLSLATKNCFVAVDELGRGTSTHDGESVAFSVLHTIASRIGCLSIFSTHYGLLANDLCGDINHKKDEISNKNESSIPQSLMSIEKSTKDSNGGNFNRRLKSITYSPHIRPMYMDCLVDQDAHRVTFLYKLKYGIAEKSHGMNVAHMAGIDLNIVKRAESVASEFERNSFTNLGNKLARISIESESNDNSMDIEGDNILVNRANKDLLPMSVISDFANLLNISRIESNSYQRRLRLGIKESISDSTSDHVGGINSGLYGSAISQNSDFENQNWGCIIDHIKKSVAQWN